MKKPPDKLDVCTCLFTLNLLYVKVIEILDTFSETLVTCKDPSLSQAYVLLVSEITRIEEASSIKDLKIQTPPLFDNLIGDVENLDIDWEGNQHYVKEYLGKIDTYCQTNCKKEDFKLSTKVKTLLSKADKALNGFRIRYLFQSSIQPPEEVVETKSETQKTTSEDEKYQWGQLKLNISQGTVQYGNNPAEEISKETEGVKFLIFLFKNPRVVEYTEIAKHIELKGYHSYCTNEDIAREVQFVKRDLLAFLKTKVGMPSKEAKKMIITKRKVGFKLRQQV